MSWLDRVLAVPVVGIATRSWIGFPAGVWAVLEKAMAGPWQGNGALSLPNPQNPSLIHVERGGGIALDLDMQQLICTFSYRVDVQDVPGRLPLLKGTEIEPYSTLLDRVRDELGMVLDIAGQPARHLIRIGVVADCQMAVGEAPPGLGSWARHLRRPYGERKVEAIGTTYTVTLSNEGGRPWDRCAYQVLAADLQPDTLLRVRMDWQRIWQPELSATNGAIKERVKECLAAAVQHFEALGAGEAGYEFEG